jgi:hypothetical protein
MGWNAACRLGVPLAVTDQYTVVPLYLTTDERIWGGLFTILLETGGNPRSVRLKLPPDTPLGRHLRIGGAGPNGEDVLIEIQEDAAMRERHIANLFAFGLEFRPKASPPRKPIGKVKVALLAVAGIFVVYSLAGLVMGALTSDPSTTAPEPSVSSVAGPTCQPLGSGVNGEACAANAESEGLRSTLLGTCGLGESRIEHDWWQESGTSIEFNYTGDEGLNHGASIDVGSGEVVCE